jgi:hypothetical protein
MKRQDETALSTGRDRDSRRDAEFAVRSPASNEKTNYRQGEEASLYRVRITPEQGRTLFLDYLKRASSPAWRNSSTSRG